MGKAIVYCGDCGRSLRDDDFEKRRAGHLDGRPFCAECRPLPAPEEPRALSGSSARLRALVESPPVSRSSVATRRAVPPPARGGRGGGVWLGVGGGAALVVILAVVVSSSGSPRSSAEPPPAPRATAAAPARPQAAPAPKPSAAADAVVEAQMLAQKAVDDAARLDRFVAEIRGMIRELPERSAKRDEIARMIDTLPPARRGEADRLRAELDAGIRDGRRDELLRSLRDALASPSLLERGNEVRAWLSEAAPLAGGRQAEFDALRQDALARLGAAESAFRLAIDFEGDFKKKLQRIDDWGGLRYAETPDLAHGGARAVHLPNDSVGAGFWMRGIHEERVYRMSAWARRLTEGGDAYLGFEFFPEGDGRLSKDTARIDSPAWKRYEFTVKAPAGARRLLFWAWNDKKKGGAYVVDDVEVVLKP